jgi:hypothetical protein
MKRELNMAHSKNKPVILLDVDGPLNPYAAKSTKRPEGYQTHRFKPKGFEYGNGLRVWLNPLHGPALMALDCELIWATAWEHDANVWIGPHLGLPELPVIEWVDRDYWNPEKLHWKTKTIASWMNKNRPNTPFMWLDDETTRRDRTHLIFDCGDNAEIEIISPVTGITDEHFAKLTSWRAQWGK